VSDVAPYDTSEIDEAVTRLVERREKFLHMLYDQRIAQAVAAERERCCAAICNICAGMRPEYGPAVLESSPLGTTQPWWQHPHLSGDPWKAVPCDADDIRARAEEGEQG